MLKHRTIYYTLLLLSCFSVLAFGITACKQQAPLNAPATTPPDLTGEVASTPLAVLSTVGGKVSVMKSGGTGWVAGETGMTLGTDDTIRTESGGYATITFFEGSTIELEAGTEISLSRLEMEGTASKIRITQEVGKTMSRVKKLVDPASGYEVETPAAVASVRGTIMPVAVDEDGTTTVGNEEGLVAVAAQGVEVILTEGTSSTIVPGEPPGDPMPVNAPPTVTPEPTPVITTVPDIVKIGITKACDVQDAFPGDNVTYTYTVINEGNVPLSGVSVTDDKTGPAAYLSGDTNADGLLDTGETWTFQAAYTVPDGKFGQLTNTATATGTGPGNQKATARATATIKVNDIVVMITSLVMDERYGRNITVAGTVNDPSITQAVLTLNGSPRTIDIVNGQFSVPVELENGDNEITVTVTKAGGITRADSRLLVPSE